MTHRVILSKGVHSFGENRYDGGREVSLSEIEYNDAKSAGIVKKEFGASKEPKDLLSENALLKEKIALLESQIAEPEEEEEEEDNGLPKNYPELKKLALAKGYTGKDLKAKPLQEYLLSL